VKFSGLEEDDYEAVGMSIQMKGQSFEFTAELTYYDQVDGVL
jgi:hypothetical protein